LGAILLVPLQEAKDGDATSVAMIEQDFTRLEDSDISH
jgi:hypothetical protein